MSEIDWSESEKVVAEEAFGKAYNRETEALISEVRSRAGDISLLEQVWNLHDYLSARRHEIDGKYDYQYSELIFALAALVKQGWLKIEELSGLDKDKRAKIGALARM
ncbi:hypothetical protein [Oscillatoria sp. FACHB-1406]|uniref:hypothetical protein n=1 Tax=Oscillatoria sp. FACHB-1406 TaxID=2692846 RepID=UPI001683108D|nr:hypothetical protein [Oscillatoria sp. FACHB-1406]